MNNYHYTYVIKNITNGMKYIGSRSCKCNPSEDKYMGSSTDVAFKKEMKKHPEHFEKTIILIYDTREEAFKDEIYLHERFDVGKNLLYYNRCKATSTGFSTEGCPKTDECKQKQSKTTRQRWANLSEEEKIIKKAAHKTEEYRKTMSEIKHLYYENLSEEEKNKYIEGGKKGNEKRWANHVPRNKMTEKRRAYMKKYKQKRRQQRQQ